MLEALAVIAVGFLALNKPSFAHRFLRDVSQIWNRFARNKVLAALAVGFAAVLLRVALLPITPIPDPSIHDEFGHLLLADTFASGRLTNPPHKFWEHFESIYVLQQPTYTSQYPPATGMLLGAAQVLSGRPWLGLLAGMGVFCGLMCWMLQAWLPPRWALLGGVLAILQVALIGYWINSYWGGFVPGIGGLLILGALPRLRSGALLLNAVWVALGLAILMNSRPVEALLFLLVTCGCLAWWIFRTNELKLWPTLRTVILPMVILLSLTLGAMLYYNFRVTGQPLVLPYMLHQKLYGSPQAFWWQKPILVKWFRHKEMEDDYLRQLRLYQRRSSPAELAKAIAGRIRDFWFFYIGGALTLPMLFFRRTLRDRGMPLMLAIILPFLCDYLTFHAFYPHYAAPLAGAFMFIAVQCWRHLRAWRWQGKRSGLLLARMVPVVAACGVVLVLASSILVAHVPTLRPLLGPLSKDLVPIKTARSVIEQKLGALGGHHLIFVHYRQPGHSPDFEWVYNRADIDSSEIVWAREMSAASDHQLREYFANRRAWVLDADAEPPQLVPYGL